MNEKSRRFEEFLVKEDIQCFEKREMEDEDHTIVYRTYIQTDFGDVAAFVLLDDTLYATIRFVLGPGVVTKENRQDILTFMNRENSVYKNFKYYIEDQDSAVYLDCINQSLDANFDPGLVYVLTSYIVEYIYSNIETIISVFKVERLPSPEHNHG